ncbi:hypothetical protein [Nonomuraea bangladeshensis]|uniref:hypothetical protein n=1 Tax=Nonomuraea bangladeshensis TaxID=404385 RepID=UPI0031DC685C
MSIAASRSPRWLRRTVVVMVPLLLLYALFKTPVWIHDHQLSQLVDRLVEYQPPPGGSRPAFYGPQSRVSGDSGDCTFHTRFDLVTDRPVDEVVKHYEAAKIADGDERYSELSIGAWVQHGYQQPTRQEAGYEYQTVIVDVDIEYYGRPLWDPRCW